jgi:hypothetical protein
MRRIFVVVLPMALAAAAVNAQSANDFRWTGTIPAGKSIEIRGLNGSIHAEPAAGNQVEVVATKRHGDWDHRGSRRDRDVSDLDSVKIEVVPNDGGVTVCAVYPMPDRAFGPGHRDRPDAGPTECQPRADGRSSGSYNDIVVDFVVKVPAGVRLAARTVNGAIDARDLKSNADIRTVNGKVFVSTSGTAKAETVNGAIEASIGSVSGTDPLDFSTVNGSVTLRLPKGANADLHADTSNGHFESDVPITIQNFNGRRRHVDGTMGSGGRRIDLHTVNGSIRLQANP